MPARARDCRHCSTFSIATLFHTSRRRLSAPVAATSPAFSTSTRERLRTRPDMAVISSDGIVGKVRDVSPARPKSSSSTTRPAAPASFLKPRASGDSSPATPPDSSKLWASSKMSASSPAKNAHRRRRLFSRRGRPSANRKIVPDPDRDAFIDIIVKPTRTLTGWTKPRDHQHPARFSPQTNRTSPPAKPIRALSRGHQGAGEGLADQCRASSGPCRSQSAA